MLETHRMVSKNMVNNRRPLKIFKTSTFFNQIFYVKYCEEVLNTRLEHFSINVSRRNKVLIFWGAVVETFENVLGMIFY